ncbi:MAG: rhamnogalacturonan acetylesterase [Lewinellaceae bacterium]|nr:rhamnogalacturonan acetylesterase [Lewinellaceae bacterium]
MMCVLGLFLSWTYPQDPVLSVHLIGDSTMANKPGTPAENPERGWGQLLPQFFSEEVVIHNHAVNGRSSKSFREDGHWAKVIAEVQPGDFVFIQFGHNDSKEADPLRYTNPWSGYRHNLATYVDEIRAKGAFPVILSSIVRRNFNAEGTLVDTHGPYPFVARQVALEKEVPFIDMQVLTEELVASLGPEKSKEYYLWTKPGEYPRFLDGVQDNTHLNLTGATAFARLVATAIRDLPLQPLNQYVTGL